MTLAPELQFPVSVRWRGGKLARVDSDDKGSLEVAAPPEFRDGVGGYWNPEELLVAACASCFVLTLAAVAEEREVPLLDATVTAAGHVSHRANGTFGFTVIEITAELETISGGEKAVRAAVHAAEKRCLITGRLGIPTHLSVSVKTVAADQDAAGRG